MKEERTGRGKGEGKEGGLTVFGVSVGAAAEAGGVAAVDEGCGFLTRETRRGGHTLLRSLRDR